MNLLKNSYVQLLNKSNLNLISGFCKSSRKYSFINYLQENIKLKGMLEYYLDIIQENSFL